MTNEEFVRRAYEIAEVEDIPGWIACLSPDVGQLGVPGNLDGVLRQHASVSR